MNPVAAACVDSTLATIARTVEAAGSDDEGARVTARFEPAVSAPLMPCAYLESTAR